MGFSTARVAEAHPMPLPGTRMISHDRVAGLARRCLELESRLSHDLEGHERPTIFIDHKRGQRCTKHLWLVNRTFTMTVKRQSQSYPARHLHAMLRCLHYELYVCPKAALRNNVSCCATLLIPVLFLLQIVSFSPWKQEEFNSLSRLMMCKYTKCNNTKIE